MLFQYVGLLDNFKSDIDELDLTCGNKTLKICKITKNELEDFLLLRRSSIFSSANDRLQVVIDVGEKMYWIAYSYEVDSKEAMIKAFNTADEEIGQILLALRLFKEGFVGIVFRMYKAENFSRTYNEPKGFRNDERIYFLPNMELSGFKEFLRAFASREKTLPHVGIALRRFTDGYERLKPEDKIIDYMIGLEALYLQDGTGELGYRLAHRTSILLGRERLERQRLFKGMNESYALRSKIVHGSKRLLFLKNEDIWFIEDMLRRSIKSFLRTPSPQWSELIF